MMVNNFSIEKSEAERCSYDVASKNFMDGSDSPSSFLERCINKINSLENDVRAFVNTDFRNSRIAAKQSDTRWQNGTPLSIIDGMPIAIKDVMETASMPTEQGSPLFKNWSGGRDCAAVAALRDAGAVIVAKSVTTEFAATQPRDTRNPWDTSRTPGGSSSGSAASVGIGMLPAALGTQVIGSIIRPASFCGAVGYKPSIGGINRGGSFDGFSQSCTGILGASLSDSWNVVRAITSRVGGDAGSLGVLGPLEMPPPRLPKTIAFLETSGWLLASANAKTALQNALTKLQDSGVSVFSRHDNKIVSEIEDAIIDSVSISRDINAWEGKWPLNTYALDMDVSKLSEPSKERLKAANNMNQHEYGDVLARRLNARATYSKAKKEFDLCVTLSATGAAPMGLGSTGDPVFTVPTSMLGIPAISLPVLECDGMPLGLQVIGFEERDAELFSFASAIEKKLK